MAWLEYDGMRFTLDAGETVVGSSERAELRVGSPQLGPRHFVIEVADGEPQRATVRPVHVDEVVSLNGVQIGGDPSPLRHGDAIGAGSTFFIYLEREDAEAAARRPATTPLADGRDAWLVDGRGATAYSLASPTIGIGRDRSNTIPIDDATASRFHAHIRREAGGLALHPAGSSGTWLNGTRLAVPTLLAEGDELTIGGTVLRVVSGALPSGVRTRISDSTAAEHEGGRRPTVQRMTPLSADAARFRWRPSRAQLALLVVVLALLFFIFLPTHK